MPHFDEARPSQNRYDFGGLEYRDITRDSGNCDALHHDKFRFKYGIAVFKKH
jgi:hypothetical protein